MLGVGVGAQRPRLDHSHLHFHAKYLRFCPVSTAATLELFRESRALTALHAGKISLET